MRHKLSFFLSVLYASLSIVALNPCPSIVRLEPGFIKGIESNNLKQFLGIPFGIVPVRFSLAEPAPSWSGVLDASYYGYSCLQQFRGSEEQRKLYKKWYNTPPPLGKEAEDCLNLNVYAPASATPGSKPVLFWIHGGSFSIGSSSLPVYNGSSLAATQDVFVVTINYRTNVFRFPGSPSLSLTEQNVGLDDQRLALAWVQRHIHAFGGDPGRITLFGESAGSGSVEMLIMQSGQISAIDGIHASIASWKNLAALTNCTSPAAKQELECLRRVPASYTKALVEEYSLLFAPTPDGLTFKYRPKADGVGSNETRSTIAPVPILVGSNADEGSTFLHNQSKAIKEEFTRVKFQCAAAKVASQSLAAGIPTWRYFFNASLPNLKLFPGSGAYHSSEIPLIFGTFPMCSAISFQQRLSAKMQQAWADFAKDPSKGPGSAQVPQLASFNSDARDEMLQMAEVDVACDPHDFSSSQK